MDGVFFRDQFLHTARRGILTCKFVLVQKRNSLIQNHNIKTKQPKTALRRQGFTAPSQSQSGKAPSSFGSPTSEERPRLHNRAPGIRKVQRAVNVQSGSHQLVHNTHLFTQLIPPPEFQAAL